MSKRSGIVVGHELMTVAAYAKMLRGQYTDAKRVIIRHGDWTPEAVQEACLALPDACAFDYEVEEAVKGGGISARSAQRLWDIADTVWKDFEDAVREATGKGLKDFDANHSLWGY